MSEELKNKKKEVRETVLEDLKQRGLNVAEDSLVAAVNSAFDNFIDPLDKVVNALANKFPKGAAVVVPLWAAVKGSLHSYVKPELLKLCDKVDGEDDPEY